MAITSYTATRILDQTVVRVVSSLSGTVFYHWYLDGSWIKRTTTPQVTLYLEPGEQAEIICQDTNDAAYDGPANAPAGYPPRRSIEWNRSIDASAAAYRVEAATGESAPGSGDWIEIGRLPADGRWTYRHLSPRLADLTWHWFRVVPIDEAGNDGTPYTLGPEFVVRRPDSPSFSVSFDDGTQLLEFAAA